MKTFLKYIAIFISLFILSFFIGVFIAMDINPYNWDMGLRLFIGITSMIAMAIISVAIITNE